MELFRYYYYYHDIGSHTPTNSIRLDVNGIFLFLFGFAILVYFSSLHVICMKFCYFFLSNENQNIHISIGFESIVRIQ